MFPQYKQSTQKYEGIAIYWRSPTNKLSRGKIYPSLDIRNTNIEKMIRSAAQYRLCPVWMYQRKKDIYFIKIEPEYIQRTTISCKYGVLFNEESVKRLVNNDKSRCCIMDSNPEVNSKRS